MIFDIDSCEFHKIHAGFVQFSKTLQIRLFALLREWVESLVAIVKVGEKNIRAYPLLERVCTA